MSRKRLGDAKREVPNQNRIVRVGGKLRSNKGVNFPGIDLGISAFTERDRELLAFAAGRLLLLEAAGTLRDADTQRLDVIDLSAQ